MVEWKKLGEVCDIGTGSNNREDNCENGLYPFFVRSQEVLRINTYLYDEEAILIPGEGGIGDIFHYIHGKYGLHQRTYRVHPISDEVKGRYIYYFLFANFKTYINAKSYKSTAASIRKPMLLEFPIPIPSLSEQQRIVGILDTFTAAIDNLKEQIAQRRKQYEYYRDQLLDLEGKPGVEMKTLGEVCKLERGVRVVKKDLQEVGAIPVYQNSLTPLGFYEMSNYPGDTTFVICAGAAGEVGYSKNAFWAADDCTCIICQPSICSKYIYDFLMVKQHILRAQVRKASVPRLSKDVIGKLICPIPSLQEQSRIVSILDTFEASIQNLEAQLKQREKQYEYYRNKLLTFE